jgi:hypothetical protein
MSILNGPVGVTGMAPQQAPVPERNDLELAHDFLEKLEGGVIPLPLLHCVASIAVSAKRIADKLESIDRNILSGNIGQGDNLRGIQENTDAIQRQVSGVISAIGNYCQQRALSDFISKM